MGARGRLAEFTCPLPLKLTEAQRYRIEALAGRRSDSLTGTIRWLIDKEWERHGNQAQEDQRPEG